MTGSAVARPGRTRRLLTNFGFLAGGRTLGALMSLAAVALAARNLGAAEFGLVVMVHASALMLKQLVSLKTSEAVIRYGVPLVEEKRLGELTGLIGRFVRLDLAAGLVACVLGLLGVWLLATPFGLPQQMLAPATLYALFLLACVHSTALGTLRLLDRYAVLSAQLAIGHGIKLLGVLVLLASPWAKVSAAYLYLWAIAFAVDHLYIWWRAWRSFRREYGSVMKVAPGIDRAEVRGFLTTVYWQSTLDAVPRQAATLLAGTLLGSAAAAIFSFARELSDVLAKPVGLLRQVVFPDLARLWRDDVARFMRVTWRTGAVTAGIGLTVAAGSLIFAGPLLGGLAGSDFAAGAAVLTLLLLAATVDLGGAALRPAAYVMGKAAELLNVQLLATAVYLVAFVGLAGTYQLAGIGWAAVLAALVTFAGSASVVQRSWRLRLEADAAAGI